MSQLVRRHYLVTGAVQGIGYRYFVRRHARALGVSGWVRNHMHGHVEIEAQGPVEAVESLEAHIRRGPEHARVEQVEVTKLALATGSTEFLVMATVKGG